VLKLKTNTEYILHLSSLDLNHGFNLYPLNINFQIVPGYDYGLRIRTSEAGDYRVICNEFCGVGHHLMVGRVIVEEGPEPLADDDDDDANVFEVKPIAANAGGDR
jgi:cytochrome c oxidase subunit 2